MRARQFLIIAIFACGLIAQITFCQQATPRRAETCEPDPRRHVPYSAEFTLTDVKPGPNGTRITYNYSEMQSLDSHGRTLESVTSPDPLQKGPARVTGETCDPVSNTQLHWDSRRNRVTVLAMPKPEERQGCWESELGDFTIVFESQKSPRADSTAVHPQDPDAAFDNRPKPTVEDLGAASIQGVEVQGTRTTWPPASGEPGEGEPPYLREEHWNSPLLGIWLKQEVDYPMGNHTIKWMRGVASLSLNDPQPSTFEAPRGYTVVTETMHQSPCEQHSLGTPQMRVVPKS